MASLDTRSGLWSVGAEPSPYPHSINKVRLPSSQNFNSCYKRTNSHNSDSKELDLLKDTMRELRRRGCISAETDSEDSGTVCGGGSSDETNADGASGDEEHSDRSLNSKVTSGTSFESRFRFRSDLPPPIQRNKKEFRYMSGE